VAAVKIDRALLLHLEALARLELDETERLAMAADLTRILDYAESLSLAPDGGAGAATPAAAPLREALPGPSLPPAALRALAPRWEAGHFLVPPVLARAGREPDAAR
jgi:aspartyl/glutamyl-tRNA(Asn/Gln) amidotransferase C subunit